MENEASMRGEGVDALDVLLALPLKERIKAVAEDLRSRTDKFRRVEAEELAKALGLGEEIAGPDWSFTCYAKIRPLEERAADMCPPSDMVYEMEGRVSPERFAVLLECFSKVDDVDEPSFGFLSAEERSLLEEALAEDELTTNLDSGLFRIANYAIKAGEGTELWFEVDLEDDGGWSEMRTPYDKREGGFVDLTDCVSDSW
jgi:hypothetical protein